MTTTKYGNHNHGPNFGKKIKGCVGCEELKAGREPVSYGPSRAQRDAVVIAENREHFRSQKHLNGGCGLVCTFGEW